MNTRISSTIAVRLRVITLLCSLAAGLMTAKADFQLVEDFEEIPVGSLDGQRGWSATLGLVKGDPSQLGNQVASFEGAGSAAAYLPLLIADGTTATLFFRIYSEADHGHAFLPLLFGRG
jgi:hypothetical protein